MVEFTDSFKSWVAENLIIGCMPAQMEAVLRGLGFSDEVIKREIDEAMNHPYVETGRKFYTKLKKREALLKTKDDLLRPKEGYLSFKQVPLPPFSEFLRDYYYENKAGLFSGAIDHWKAAKWTPRSLVKKVGAGSEVEIQHGREKNANYEIESHNLKKKVKFGEFIDMLESVESSNDFYLTANNEALSKSSFESLKNDMGEIGDGYFKKNGGRQPFIWIGPKGVITPLHHDLTNNFIVQVYGEKTFHLIPSMQVPYVYNHLHVFSEVDLLKENPATHPDFGKATPIRVKLKAGDSIFVPIGWWHHVVGDTASISLTLSNFNLPENRFIDYPEGTRY